MEIFFEFNLKGGARKREANGGNQKDKPANFNIETNNRKPLICFPSPKPYFSALIMYYRCLDMARKKGKCKNSNTRSICKANGALSHDNF